MQHTSLSPTSLGQALEEVGVHVSSDALPSLHSYVDMLMRWNRRMNLVGARTWQDAVQDLVADSVRLAAFLDGLDLGDAPLCWDPGAGAGLPGIPLRCVWQKGTYHMIEIREKRALFLSQVQGTLQLPETFVHHADINVFLARQADAKADLVVSRAFMPWEDVLALFAPRLSSQGRIVVMGRMVPPEETLLSLPMPFRLVASTSYPTPRGTRTLWAVGRADKKD